MDETPARRLLLGAAVLTATLLTTACGPSAEPQESASASPSGEVSADADCNSTQSDAVLQTTIEQFDDAQWDASISDISGFDACAELSWITLKGTSDAGDIEQVVFFNEGEYVGEAYDEYFAYPTEVEEVADGTVTVTWTFPEQIDRNGDPQTKAASTYTWNADTASVDREGQLPPYAGDDWNTVGPAPDN